MAQKKLPKIPDLSNLVLLNGSHHTRREGVCALEAAAWLAGEHACGGAVVTTAYPHTGVAGQGDSERPSRACIAPPALPAIPLVDELRAAAQACEAYAEERRGLAAAALEGGHVRVTAANTARTRDTLIAALEDTGRAVGCARGEATGPHEQELCEAWYDRLRLARQMLAHARFQVDQAERLAVDLYGWAAEVGRHPARHGAAVIPVSGYFDGGKGRRGFAPLDRCYRSPVCALYREHGGNCDPRSERARAKALWRALRIDGGLWRPAAIACHVEREGTEALRVAETLHALRVMP
jgi:hypothetical protein